MSGRFFLQARASGQRVTVKCEKQQAAAIVQYLRRVLSDLPPAGRQADAERPRTHRAARGVLRPRARSASGYDRATDRLLIQLEEVGEVDEEGEIIDDDRPGPRPAVREPRPGRGVLRARRRRDRGGPADVPVVRQPDRSRRTPLSADELSRELVDGRRTRTTVCDDDRRRARTSVLLRVDTVDDPVRHLRLGEITVEGRMP